MTASPGGDPAPAAPAILHVDLDAFYASCEERRHPDLRGRPLAVGGEGGSRPGARGPLGRGVVAAASYAARAHGVHSALPLAEALRRCPSLTVLPVDMAHYREVSEQVFAIFHRVTPLVEPRSLDEAFLDVTGSRRRFGAAAAIGRELQAAIAAECGLDASVGVGTTKTVTKIASALRKPRGFVEVPPGTEAAFLAPLPVAALPGIGPKTALRLREMRIATLGLLARWPAATLREALGPAAAGLQERARGIDPTPVEVPGIPKSLSREETYPRDQGEGSQLRERIRVLSAEVARRLRERELSARAVTVKLRYADFTTLVRRRAIPPADPGDLSLAGAALRLFEQTWERGRPVRLLGVGVEGLEAMAQLELFDEGDSRRLALDATLDQLRHRFGPAVIRRGPAAAAAALDWNRDDLARLRPADPGSVAGPGV
ncbi:MAG TPA: DNA polymerase IV [Candidatus Dormibacteraeota bacterium]|nr:DNA polymerase IV [Candidatus Dormibacteraeota bacterium]